MTDTQPATRTFPNRVFSGAQPSGNMHLGNYLGAFRNWVKLQDSFECIYCVVDMHAITVWQDPADLVAQTREAAAAYIAAGVNPEKSILFNQSQVSGHAELAWIFNCVSRLGWLNRMTQFKDKAGKNRENASTGLYVYPNLMAADILLYQATHVPVGEDQKQHLELTRDIAQKFNNDFGVEMFPLTEPIIQEEGARIMSLRDGSAKMSKSDPSEYSRINLNDDADAIALKIRKAKTDPEPLPALAKDLEGRPEALNLVGIYAALTDRTRDSVCTEFEGQGFAEFKKALTDVAVSKLSPITGEMRRLIAAPDHIDAVLRQGAERAAAIAAPILKDVKKAVGFIG
ncbi:tryptophan--tRNA ligase [Pseudokordiimonas caeni]|uniref:tryptophan--tRNA ligase n=1 Tax=Pseudokordiimonas caeni TaxID=2997908 RepID=UPI002810D0B7|nr:tryptophan--tRNA ligase [Pseudokordiimonas caeni]